MPEGPAHTQSGREMCEGSTTRRGTAHGVAGQHTREGHRHGVRDQHTRRAGAKFATGQLHGRQQVVIAWREHAKRAASTRCAESLRRSVAIVPRTRADVRPARNLKHLARTHRPPVASAHARSRPARHSVRRRHRKSPAPSPPRCRRGTRNEDLGRAKAHLCASGGWAVGWSVGWLEAPRRICARVMVG